MSNKSLFTGDIFNLDEKLTLKFTCRECQKEYEEQKENLTFCEGKNTYMVLQCTHKGENNE